MRAGSGTAPPGNPGTNNIRCPNLLSLSPASKPPRATCSRVTDARSASRRVGSRCGRRHAQPSQQFPQRRLLSANAGRPRRDQFSRSAPSGAIFRPPVTELSSHNTDQVVVKVSDGTLLVFPAWLPHSVSVNTSARTRISVSFNQMAVTRKSAALET
ncbi:putative 2OG-Fe(II) oxygenase [Paraburkholderia piptadeniae]|uniref:putative 2OG-Fe(II) oxygenase n=1 Tax=Paraburkholderia piptadeniae TaxID=1701573 RepID=UPI0034DCCF7F